ncbi:hypothetical protein PENSPDRAFT_734293 [Peniophora sp. CONT]|nr:hypothetical protein PENSPDRAFT_734293 [Peniophora sp. CONT]
MLNIPVATTSDVVERDVWGQWRLHAYALGSVSHVSTSNPQVSNRDRVHSRLIIGDYGIPLYRFATLPELLGAYRDAMDGHRELHSNGILHRDISFGSVFIAPHVERGERGLLVDFDYAAKDHVGEDGSKLYDDGRTGTMSFMSLDVLARQRVTVERPSNVSGQAISLEEELKAIVFEGDNNSMLATTPAEKRPEALRHSVLHELESFWLILLWICLKRIRPFTARDHSVGSFHWGDNRWRASNFIKKFFDETVPSSILCERRTLFENGISAFDCDVVPAISPYFAVIVPFVRVIFRVLCEVYYDRAAGKRDRTDDTSLYDDFLRGLEICLEHKKMLLWDSNLAPDHARDEYERRVRYGFYSNIDIPPMVQRVLDLPRPAEPAPSNSEA